MKFSKKIISLLIIFGVPFVFSGLIIYACPTPIFDSLSPNLQNIMRLDAERTKKMFPQNHLNETLEKMAERDLCRYYITIDGSLYRGHGGPMKLTNEDIESLYNLPNVKHLNLKRFDLKNVDINKFLGINKNKTMEFLDLNGCFFDTLHKDQVAARITRKEYTVGIYPCIWIAWPGVDPDEIFDGR